MNRVFLGLLLLVPATVLAPAFHISPLWTFFLAALGIVPLAKFIGDATEELAGRTNAAVGGLLNATFGNATEILIGVFALQAGLFEVVKASLTGSIIGNLLFVLGLAMLAGGIRHPRQRFNQTSAHAGISTLFLAVIALVVPALFLLTAPSAGARIIEELSVLVAVLMLLVYGASLWFSLRTHRHLYTEEVQKYEPQWTVRRSVLILAAATAAVAWLSEILVSTIEPVVQHFGWTQLFIGVIVVAVVGNAAEHTSAVLMAIKNRMDLSLQIAIGSAAQIALFAAPVLVLIGLAIGHPMNLIFNTFELITIALSVLITSIVVQDGESNWLEGTQLLLAYVIMAVAFFFHP